LIPLARTADEVIGVDVAPTMVVEAARNCAGLRNVRLESTLTNVGGRFDLIHSYIVFQHIPVHRGMTLVAQLLGMLATDGIMALHVTYGRHAPLYRKLIHRTRALIPRVNAVANIVQRRPVATPMMQMNEYDVAALCRMARGSCLRVYETDHGGHLGTMLLLANEPWQTRGSKVDPSDGCA
jgi:trans-aconitate methyltransferase